MKKHHILCVCIISLIFIFTGCSHNHISETFSNEQQVNYTETTFAAIDKLVNYQFQDFYSYFDSNLQEEIAQSELQTLWYDTIVQYGMFDYYQTDITSTTKDGYQIVDVPCVFQHGSVTIRLTWNNHGEICGFFLTDNISISNSLQLENDIEVTFGSEKYPITGNLTIPDAEGPFPAVILVHGSGASDRNEQIGPNLPFMDLAKQLTAQGIAVLRYDKRTYTYANELETIDNFTVQDEVIDDVVAALTFLQSQNNIQNSQIYIAGHSLGGYLIPRIAQQTPEAAGYILLAAPARPIEKLFLEQTEYILSLEKDLEPSAKEKILTQLQETVSTIQSLTSNTNIPKEKLLGYDVSYWLDLQHYNPLFVAQQIEKPLLFLQGSRDYQVTTNDFLLWKQALKNSPNATFQLYDNLNHLFQEGTGKSTPAEYQKKNSVSPIIGETCANFILLNSTYLHNTEKNM